MSGHTKGVDAYAYLDLELPVGTYCAPRRPITDWSVIIDRWVSAAGANTNNAQYSNGVFTTQVEGVYHCCMSFRGRQGGYHDWSVLRYLLLKNLNIGAKDSPSPRNGNRRYAAAGTRVTGNAANGW